MRVLLIRPPYTRLKGAGQAPYFPLGLGYITSVLRENGFDANLYHAENPQKGDDSLIPDADIGFDLRSKGYRRYLDAINNDSHYVWEEVRQTLRAYKPDLVGISLLSVEVASALKISKLCKEYDKDCYVLWGGLHPSFMPEECLRNEEVDFVIRGEGEYASLELCNTLKNGGSFSEIKGLSFKKNAATVHNPMRDAIAEIDKVPPPARDAVLYPESFDFKSLGSMIVSRGCPFRCTFCSSRNFWDKKVRLRTPENVIQEIKVLKEKFGTRYIMFWDDSFTINRKVIERYCRSIIDSGLKISWKTATRADLIDSEILDLMKKAGCVKLEIGVESGSERIKKLINKDVSNKQIKMAFDLIQRKGIGVGGFFMAGFPDETIEDLTDTFNLMKELRAGELAFNIFDPMPGSSEYDKCIEMGLVAPAADWNNFPFWPDAYYVKNIKREDFDKYVNTIAHWLYNYNNTLSVRLKRSKQYLLFMLKNDPAFLLSKVMAFITRRRRVHKLKSGSG
ncbi:B12-binding domain-containing radical SAM protein [Candidatus Magnetominusculus xianensis]|uniref:Radical SAM domain-containing protein n=1 Tax=Candidatus Magnetominusculus xianensis TaxID=1748249 RepID=A0ABR5SG22_9BACT|nr:radical SAM protein [Candidatus Magnetominusculus xianensis]KWT84435.1 radical SAM domain-containing protein [Candidatus Magnetominusculus xianensis]MBF0404269.1 B12-binding domain-containing radical SAM protein [Nitrospirota bacterium]